MRKNTNMLVRLAERRIINAALDQPNPSAELRHAADHYFRVTLNHKEKAS